MTKLGLPKTRLAIIWDTHALAHKRRSGAHAALCCRAGDTQHLSPLLRPAVAEEVIFSSQDLRA